MEVRLLVSKKLLNRKEGFRRTIKKPQVPEKDYSGSHQHPEETKKQKEQQQRKKKGIFSDSKRCIEPTYTTAEWNVLGVYEEKKSVSY